MEFSNNQKLENMGRKRRMQALANLEALHGLKPVIRVDMEPAEFRQPGSIGSVALPHELRHQIYGFNTQGDYVTVDVPEDIPEPPTAA